jgi:uncharacterized protein (DUF885 family)
MGEAARVLDIYWDRFLAVEPLFATLVGDARFDDALPDQAEDGRAERHRVHAGLLAAAGGIDAARLVPEERRALALATALARLSSAAWSTAWTGCGRSGTCRSASASDRGCCWAGRVPAARRHRPAAGGLPAAAGGVPRLPRRAGGRCSRGLAGGVVAPRVVVARTVGQVERLLAIPVADGPALAPLAAGGDQERTRGSRRSAAKCTRPTPGSWRCSATTCRAPRRRWAGSAAGRRGDLPRPGPRLDDHAAGARRRAPAGP